MIVLLQLIVLGIFALIGVTIWNGMRRDRLSGPSEGKTIEGEARDVSNPGRFAAETLRDFEHAQAALKQAYPALFAMFGGYLNGHSINQAGGLEAAAAEMIADWRARSGEVSRELVRLLAKNETEDECRAIVMAACDAEFNQEGYRAWLMWLLRAFSAPPGATGAAPNDGDPDDA